MFIRKHSALILALIFFSVAGAGAYLLGFMKPNLFDKVRKGLDIQGGIHVVFEGRDTPDMPVTDKAMDDAKRIIEDRVNRLGVAEPVIQREGERRIIVELPGIKDPEKALEAIGRTALLEFKDSDGKVIVSGKDLDPKGVDVQIEQTGRVVVTLQFKKEGAARFAEATKKAFQFRDSTGKKDDPRNHIGIYLDGQLVQNPGVEGPIDNGRAIITGYGSVEEARRVVVALQSGALPVKLEPVENRTISPTLGRDSLEASKAATVIGTVAVLAFMFLYYRIPGFWADFALFVYLLLFLGALLAVNATLTLPGIAGFVLSVGMAVDANVIIFERIKEELRLGKTVRAAMDAGFANAFRAIIDSNVTTLLGAAVLFYFGTGPVRGFALTLALGVVISMFTAITLTRFVLRLLVNAGIKPGPLFFTRQGEAGGAAQVAATGGQVK